MGYPTLLKCGTRSEWNSYKQARRRRRWGKRGLGRGVHIPRPLRGLESVVSFPAAPGEKIAQRIWFFVCFSIKYGFWSQFLTKMATENGDRNVPTIQVFLTDLPKMGRSVSLRKKVFGNWGRLPVSDGRWSHTADDTRSFEVRSGHPSISHWAHLWTGLLCTPLTYSGAIIVLQSLLVLRIECRGVANMINCLAQRITAPD